MALPTLKYPTFPLTIPSTNELVKFRPFTVAEEKLLLMASESKEFSQITDAITDVLNACFFGKVDTKVLPSFDIEFMFLNVRAKSVSETIEMQFRNQSCPQEEASPCKKNINLRIQIDDIKIHQAQKDGSYKVYDPKSANKNGTKIILDDGLGLTIVYPNIDKVNEANKQENAIEQIEELICSCITTVFDEENVYTDFTRKEMREWYSNLLSKQKEQLVDFIRNIPVLRHEINYKCATCGYEEKMVFEGLQSFL